MASIDKDNRELRIYDWNFGDVSIHDLKKWVDTQIEKGNTKVRLEISWGHYSDIDSLDIIAEK